MIDWTLPIPTVSEANVCEHWSQRHKRHKLQKLLIVSRWNVAKPKIAFPVTVRLTRIGVRLLDDDNLRIALKHVRDVIADQLFPGLPPGQADGSSRIKWEYAQAKGKLRSVRIEIYPTLDI